MSKTPLPWGKREIIDAMVLEYRPFQFEDKSTWAFFTQFRALQRLALSENAPVGFAARLAERVIARSEITELEDALFGRLGRVWQALRDGRDPNAAYDTPLRSEMH